MRLAFSNFGEVVSVFKGRHKFNRSIRNGKKHVRIFPAGGDPAILPRKIFFHGNIHRDVFPRKRWCCATGAKIDTRLARIFLLSLPLKKILECLSLSRVVLLHRIKTLCSLTLLQRFFLALNLCNNLLLRRRMWLGEIILRKLLIQIRTLCQNESHALILVHRVSLALGRWLVWGTTLSHLRRKPYLRILKIRPVWEGLLRRCQIHTSEGEPSA